MNNTFDFGRAITLLKEGKKVRRRPWNEHLHIRLLYTDGLPCILINTSGHLHLVKPDAPKELSWFASHEDMLAEDWVLAE